MNDELLRYYNQEILDLEEVAREFAERHGPQAARLGIGSEPITDPHVQRLVQSFAFLTGRIKHKFDDSFPEISDAMLSTLYPAYLAPIPSMSIVEFKLKPDKAEQVGGITVPRHSILESDSIDDVRVTFRTGYETRVFPVSVVHASVGGIPFNAGKLKFKGAEAALRIRLKCQSDKVNFSQMEIWPLRFYLKGQDPQVLAIYEAICNDAIAVGVGNGVDDPAIHITSADCISPAGFGPDESLLPFPPNSFVGYRLLSEYFAFFRKFLFFDIHVEPLVAKRIGNICELVFYLKRLPVGLEQQVKGEVFRTGCTPIINLVNRSAEPIPLTPTQSEFRIIPDARAEYAYEPHSVTRVVASNSQGERREFLPLYSFERTRGSAPRTYYHTTRRLSYRTPQSPPTTDLYLSLVDLDFSPTAQDDWTLEVDTVCVNRDLPARLSSGTNAFKLSLSGVASLTVESHSKPTPTVRSGVGNANRWKLISHLTLNHLSIAEKQLGAEALRHIFRLYDYGDNERTRSAIDSIVSLSSRRTVARYTAAAEGFARGMEVTINFDESRFADNGLFLFASVLERFLGLYCSINSFCAMVARTTVQDREIRRWKPRAGEQLIL